MVDDDQQAEPSRRSGQDRRRYNRRTTSPEVAPPYYEAFERMAAALEGIRDQLARSEIVLPNGPERSPAPEPRSGSTSR